MGPNEKVIERIGQRLFPAGSQVLSADKKTIYIVQADGSWKKAEREQYEGEWEEVNGQ